MTKRALITGITGQDGAYLAEFLLDKGYEVHGIKRRASSFNTDRIDHLYQDPHEPDARLILHYGDLTDATNLIRIVQQVQPDEIYNLAAQSHVRVSLRDARIHGERRRARHAALLEAIRILGLERHDPLLPGLDLRAVRQGRRRCRRRRRRRSIRARPYARRQGLRLLDHGELPRGLRHVRLQRHPVQPRVAAARRDVRDAQDHARLARIKPGLQDCLYLGNLDARRDWGHARDYVEAQWLMLQQPQPEDYVIATGEQHSVREFVELAVAAARHASSTGSGAGVEREAASTRSTGQHARARSTRAISARPRSTRCSAIRPRRGRSSAGARTTGFAELVQEMVAADLAGRAARCSCAAARRLPDVSAP